MKELMMHQSDDDYGDFFENKEALSSFNPADFMPEVIEKCKEISYENTETIALVLMKLRNDNGELTEGRHLVALEYLQTGRDDFHDVRDGVIVMVFYPDGRTELGDL